MKKQDGIKVIKERHIGGNIERYYQNNKLVKKIDYTSHKPFVYLYDSEGKVECMKVLESKSHKKLWIGILGSLLVLGYLYNKCNSDKHIPEKQIIKSSQYQR